MSELQEWREKAKPYRASVDVCVDGELVAELEAAQARLKEESEGMLAANEELEAHVLAVAKEVEARTRTFTFESIGRLAWRKLKSEHPPTEEQAAEEFDHNPETFPVEAFLASCIEPKLSREDAEWLCHDLPEGEFLRLWGALLKANLIGGDAKKAVATAVAGSSEKK